MATVKSDILPKGRYWVDAFGEKRAIASEWLKTQGTAFTPRRVRVLTTESFDSDPPADWFLFEVLEPMPWPQADLGAPTIAGPEVKSRADTVQRPPPEKDPLDEFDPKKILPDFAKGAGVVIGAAALAGFALLVWKLRAK